MDILAHIEKYNEHIDNTVSNGECAAEYLTARWNSVLEWDKEHLPIDNQRMAICIVESLESQYIFDRYGTAVNEYQPYSKPIIRRILSEPELREGTLDYFDYSPSRSYTVTLDECPESLLGQDREALRLEYLYHQLRLHLNGKVINGLLLHFHSGESDVELTAYY